MTDQEIIAVSRRLLKPYVIPPTCSYLSEDQRELSKLNVAGRSAWMAEWLLLAREARSSSGNDFSTRKT
jgi:hypothetical protein